MSSPPPFESRDHTSDIRSQESPTSRHDDDPISSPFDDPAASSPYREPISSPYRDPLSSPYRDPLTSPYRDPLSSPYCDPPSSSPSRGDSVHHYEGPPRANSSQASTGVSSSDDECGHVVKKVCYKFDHEPPKVQSSLIDDPSQYGSFSTRVSASQMEDSFQKARAESFDSNTNSGSVCTHQQSPSLPENLFPETNDSNSEHTTKTGSGDWCNDGSSNIILSADDINDVALSCDVGSDSDDSVASTVAVSEKSSSATSISTSSSRRDYSSEDSDGSSGDEISSVQVSMKVFEQSNFSVDAGVLSLMNLFMKHKLEKCVISDVLKVVLKFLPLDNNMPKSPFLLFEYVSNLCPISPEKYHFYCKTCHFYVGEDSSIKCPLCNSDCNKFIELSLADQIKNLFVLHNLADEIDKYASDRKDTFVEGSISDICDGSEYKRASCGGQYDLVLLSYTDGVDLSKSSDVKFWPLECVICEISPLVRFRFVLTCGIWIDSCKPLMNTYLVPFVNELKDLHENGVKWTHPKSKIEFISKVSAPGFCGDAPVRAQLQNILQHGGRHCCNICEQKMVICRCSETQEKKRVFNMLENPSHLRTAERMKKQGERTKKIKQWGKSTVVKPCKGVKGRTIISQIPSCDRSTVVYPEYMHILLGIIKLFMKLWLKSSEKDAWSLKAHEDSINSLLLGIKVPDFLRVARSGDCYTKWKASECRSFLLFYSLVVLSPHMKQDYLQHWILFVSAMYLLLQESITNSDVDQAEISLRLFLRDFNKLYRAEYFTYNLHNLIHMSLTVRRWGPLWANSAFMFESLNGKLTDCMHGTKNQAKELTNTLKLFQGIQVLKARVEAKNTCPETLIETEVVEFRNKVKTKLVNDRMRRAMSSEGLEYPVVYYRAIIKGEAYTSVKYSKQIKRNNYTVCYLNAKGVKQYGEIYLFCEGSDDKKMVFVNSFNIEHLRTFRHFDTNIVVTHIVPVVLSDNFDLICAENILFKVIRVGDFICLRPNKVEVNL